MERKAIIKSNIKDNFKDKDSIEITNVRNVNQMEDTPSVLEVCFDDNKTYNRVVMWKDGVVIGVNERFTSANKWLKKNPDFDTIVDDEVREFELGA